MLISAILQEPDRSVPILVVGVPGLPRDALVEVEMVSFRDNAIPTALFTYQEAQTVNAESLESDPSTADRVRSWPFWKCNGMLDETELVQTDELSDSSFKVESRVISFQRNLCMGFVEVSAVEGAANAGLDLDVVIERLVQGVASLSTSCDLALNHALLTLRVYHTPSIDGSEVSSLVAKHLALRCGVIKRLPVLAVPVTSLKPDCVVAAQVIAVDAHQLQSELWIHSK